LPASTVSSTSAGLFRPSARIRSINAPAFASIRLIVMPVCASKSL